MWYCWVEYLRGRAQWAQRTTGYNRFTDQVHLAVHGTGKDAPRSHLRLEGLEQMHMLMMRREPAPGSISCDADGYLQGDKVAYLAASRDYLRSYPTASAYTEYNIYEKKKH